MHRGRSAVVAAGCTSSFVITAMSFTASESAGSVIATSRPPPMKPTGTARYRFAADGRISAAASLSTSKSARSM